MVVAGDKITIECIDIELAARSQATLSISVASQIVTGVFSRMASISLKSAVSKYEQRTIDEDPKGVKGCKPAFRQQDSHKKKRVEKVWRRPRGLHSKIRHNKWSYPKRIQIGYKSPAEVRDFTRQVYCLSWFTAWLT